MQATTTASPSKTAVNKAGKYLALGEDNDEFEAKSVVEAWRACHVEPLKEFNDYLQTRIADTSCSAVVSQRLKRLPSIISKLQRENQMELSRMQDIGGIRAVVPDMTCVRRIQKECTTSPPDFATLQSCRDYIIYPKTSGYRSVHMIFKNTTGFQIELQIRTQLQHAWATAVETMGTFLKKALKSNEGPEEWLSFFSIAASAFAIIEKSPRIPQHNNKTDYETFETLRNLERKLSVIEKLSGFRAAADHITRKKRKAETYHLITLNSNDMTVNVSNYAYSDIDRAAADYSLAETHASRTKGIQVVLVASESIAELKKAYPSYFLDSAFFIAWIKAIVGVDTEDKAHTITNKKISWA